MKALRKKRIPRLNLKKENKKYQKKKNVPFEETKG